MNTNFTPPALELRQVSAGYDTKPVLHHISFTVSTGERVAVLGANGAGKSTLFRVIVRLLPVKRGKVLLFGEPVETARTEIAYLPQDVHLPARFPATVSDVVMMGRYRFLKRLHPPSPDDRRAVRQALELVRLAHLADQPITVLSGGQRQRMFLARALAQEARVLLLDEPFRGLDVGSQQVIQQTLETLSAQGAAVLLATHNLALASLFDRVIILREGHVVGDGPPATLLTAERLMDIFDLVDVPETIPLREQEEQNR